MSQQILSKLELLQEKVSEDKKEIVNYCIQNWVDYKRKTTDQSLKNALDYFNSFKHIDNIIIFLNVLGKSYNNFVRLCFEREEEKIRMIERTIDFFLGDKDSTFFSELKEKCENFLNFEDTVDKEIKKLPFNERVIILDLIYRLKVSVIEQDTHYEITVRTKNTLEKFSLPKGYNYSRYFNFLVENYSNILTVSSIGKFIPIRKTPNSKFKDGTYDRKLEYAVIHKLSLEFNKYNNTSYPCYLNVVFITDSISFYGYNFNCQVEKIDNIIRLTIFGYTISFKIEEDWDYLTALNFMKNYYPHIEDFSFYFLESDKKIPSIFRDTILYNLIEVFKGTSGSKSFYPEILEKFKITDRRVIEDAKIFFNPIKVSKTDIGIKIYNDQVSTYFVPEDSQFCYYNYIKFILNDYNIIKSCYSHFIDWTNQRFLCFIGEINIDTVSEIFNLMSRNENKRCFLKKMIERDEIVFNISEDDIADRFNFDLIEVSSDSDKYVMELNTYFGSYELTFPKNNTSYKEYFKTLESNYDFSQFGCIIPKIMRSFLINALKEYFESREVRVITVEVSEDQRVKKFQEFYKYFNTKDEIKDFISKMTNDEDYCHL